jgi:hypothetical protein
MGKNPFTDKELAILDRIYADESILPKKRVSTAMAQIKAQLGIDRQYGGIWAHYNSQNTVKKTSDSNPSRQYKKSTIITKSAGSFIDQLKEFDSKIFDIMAQKRSIVEERDDAIAKYLKTNAEKIESYAITARYKTQNIGDAANLPDEEKKKVISILLHPEKHTIQLDEITLLLSSMTNKGRILFPLHANDVKSSSETIPSIIYNGTILSLKDIFDATLSPEEFKGFAATTWQSPISKDVIIPDLTKKVNSFINTYDYLKNTKVIILPINGFYNVKTTENGKTQ